MTKHIDITELPPGPPIRRTTINYAFVNGQSTESLQVTIPASYDGTVFEVWITAKDYGRPLLITNLSQESEVRLSIRIVDPVIVEPAPKPDAIAVAADRICGLRVSQPDFRYAVERSLEDVWNARGKLDAETANKFLVDIGVPASKAASLVQVINGEDRF